MVQPASGMRVIDLGCGTGALTLELHRRLGAASTLGIDSSPAMLTKTTSLEAEGLRFLPADIAELEPGIAPGLDTAERFNLVFSNAALHWVDDHERLLRRVQELVAPGGQLAVQVPANHGHPSHTVAAELAGESPFREALAGFVRRSPVLLPEEYATLLDRLGMRAVEVVLRVYTHQLEGPEAVVDWVHGTSLTPYQERLPAPLFEQFLAHFRERLRARLAATRPLLFTFNRILFRAVQPD